MFRPPFTLEQIRTFLAVAAREHVTHAAEDIHLSQGAVTQQIQLFEKAIGLPLFERVGRGIRLNAAGDALTPACRALVRAAEAVIETAESLRSLETGSVNVGASQTSAAHYLPPVLGRFLKLHPGVRMTVTSGNTASVWAEVAGGGIDCGVVEGELLSPSLLSVVLAEDEVVLVAAPGNPLLKLKRLSVGDLEGALYLARELGSGTEALVRERLGSTYDRLKRVELGQLDAVRAAAVAGVGISALPRVSISSELRTGQLVALGLPPWRRQIHAVRRPGTGGPALEGFWACLTEVPVA